uniref:TPT domain-containing protein n=1 Tax=Ascaris lumbricoides TaxID=6252 RepID=A0A0M3IWI8_ASCLU
MGNDSRAIVVPKSSGYKTVETNCPMNEPPADLSGVKNKTLREILISSLVMACVALSWALSTQFSKSALNLDKAHFYAPYSLVWFSTNFMTTCYPVYMVYVVITKGISRETIRTAHE